jgi:hypothetical protein
MKFMLELWEISGHAIFGFMGESGVEIQGPALDPSDLLFSSVEFILELWEINGHAIFGFMGESRVERGTRFL